MKILRASVWQALEWHAHRAPAGRWWFSDPELTHTEDEALKIAEACLFLGTRVTDVMSSQTWHALVSRLADLDERIDRLEKGAAQ